MTNYEYHVTVVATDDEGTSTPAQTFTYGSLDGFLLTAESVARFYDRSFEELSIDIVKVPVEDEDLLALWERTLLDQDEVREADAYAPESGWDYWDLEPEPVANTAPKRSFFSKVFGRKAA